MDDFFNEKALESPVLHVLNRFLKLSREWMRKKFGEDGCKKIFDLCMTGMFAWFMVGIIGVLAVIIIYNNLVATTIAVVIAMMVMLFITFLIEVTP